MSENTENKESSSLTAAELAARIRAGLPVLGKRRHDASLALDALLARTDAADASRAKFARDSWESLRAADADFEAGKRTEQERSRAFRAMLADALDFMSRAEFEARVDRDRAALAGSSPAATGQESEEGRGGAPAAERAEAQSGLTDPSGSPTPSSGRDLLHDVGRLIGEGWRLVLMPGVVEHWNGPERVIEIRPADSSPAAEAETCQCGHPREAHLTSYQEPTHSCLRCNDCPRFRAGGVSDSSEPEKPEAGATATQSQRVEEGEA